MHVFTTHGTNDVSFNFAWKHKSAAELTILKRDRESTTPIYKSTYMFSFSWIHTVSAAELTISVIQSSPRLYKSMYIHYDVCYRRVCITEYNVQPHCVGSKYLSHQPF